MEYYITTSKHQQHLIQIEIPLPANAEATPLHLPTWRPGRYETGLYIENICDVSATNASGQTLKVTKTASHHWEVAPSREAFRFRYHYYAVATDAGGSGLTEDLLYINGVNLFMYQPGRLDEACPLHLQLGDDFKVACGLPQKDGVWMAADFHQLVDAPILASPHLQHHAFDVAGTPHNLWFYGDVNPDWRLLEQHFTDFGLAQVELFGDFPVDEYHYLFYIHNFAAYHGVEHFNSTVITLGPGYRLMQPEIYKELLGVSCHELFHTWNVKAIRPHDMQPYDYEGHNYSHLHYVTEGVTTYYGDLMLLKSGVWSLEAYLDNFNQAVLKRHYANNGRDHISLEEASFDSWVNGYKVGVPNRKISFYTKGCLAAFILDYLVRFHSNNTHSLDTVMREMWETFGKTGKGYTGEDYRAIAEKQAGVSLKQYFSEVISGTTGLENYLINAASYFGLGIYPMSLKNGFVQEFGLLPDTSSPFVIVKQVYENSPAAAAGVQVGDELVAVGGLKAQHKDMAQLFDHFKGEAFVQLTVFRNGKLQNIDLNRSPAYKTPMYLMNPLKDATPAQLANRNLWMQSGAKE